MKYAKLLACCVIAFAVLYVALFALAVYMLPDDPPYMQDAAGNRP